MNEQILLKIFRQCWSDETSNSPKDWFPSAPSNGQCAVTALVVQERFGGDIYRLPNVGGQSHYYNMINGKIVDLTADQFSTEINYNGELQDSKKLLSCKGTSDRHNVLNKRFGKAADAPLPIDQIEHVSIRDPSYVAGTNDHPEVGVFVQTHTRHKPLSNQKLCVGQTVWMKWVSGPIVARSKLLSWHSGEFADGNINHVRELTIGSGLFGLSDYWQSVSTKHNGFYTVIHLSEEEWVDDLVYPVAKSFGSSWVYLDSDFKQCSWLSSLDEEKDEATTDRRTALPAQLRFLVLRRDNYTCRYCGRKAPNVELHVDHVVPWSTVREHKIDNLVASCRDCNLGKGTLSASTQS
jgi:hypothetical protein